MQQLLKNTLKRLLILPVFAIVLFFAAASFGHVPVNASLTCSAQEKTQGSPGEETGCNNQVDNTMGGGAHAMDEGDTVCAKGNEPVKEEGSNPLLLENVSDPSKQIEDDPAGRILNLNTASYNQAFSISPAHCDNPENDSSDAHEILFSLESEPDLIQVGSAADLAAIMSTGRLDFGYIQTGDICLSDYLDGSGWVPIGESGNPFTGTYDGGGFMISGLYINRPQDTQAGLFGSIGTGAVVKNVILELLAVTGKSQVGGLAGFASHSEISNCSVRGMPDPDGGFQVGAVSASDNQAGGLVGYTSDSLVEQSSAAISVHGNNFVGGLIGTAEKTVIINCYATGTAGGNAGIGGLVGSTTRSAAIENSFAAVHVDGESALGGLVGHNRKSSGSSAHSSYWDIDIAGPIESVLGSGLSGIEMSAPGSFVGWDFTETWVLTPGSAYPRLLWQLAAADPPVDDGGNGNGGGESPGQQPPINLPGNPGAGRLGVQSLSTGPVFTGPYVTMSRLGQAESLCSVGILNIIGAYLELLEEIISNVQEEAGFLTSFAGFQAKILLEAVYFLLNNHGHRLEPAESALLLQRADLLQQRLQVVF